MALTDVLCENSFVHTQFFTIVVILRYYIHLVSLLRLLHVLVEFFSPVIFQLSCVARSHEICPRAAE